MHTKLPIISFFQKLIIFCCLIFEEFEQKFLNQEFNYQLPEQVWSKGSFDFFKIVPLGAPRSLIQMDSKRKGVIIEMDLSPTVITNSFENLFKNSKTFFHFFCTDFMIMTFIPLCRNINKIRNDKRCSKQVYSFHANVDIKTRFTSLKKCIQKWKDL